MLEAALEAVITLFDTGASYADGFAERRLGRLLRQLGADPERLVISTKIGTVRDARGRLVKDFAPEGLLDQVAASLERLGLERVSILLLHGPWPALMTDALGQALDAVRERGLAEFIGVNAGLERIEAARCDPRYGVLMPFLSVRISTR